MQSLKLVLRAKTFGVQFFTRSLSSAAPLLTVNLPALNETRSFVITSTLNSLGELQDAIIAEDASVQSVSAVSSEGLVFSKFTPVTFLLQNGFTLELLDDRSVKQSTVIPPTPITGAVVDEVHDKIKSLAGSLEVVENKISIQNNLRKRLDELQMEFAPLEEKRLSLLSKSRIKTNAVVWGGLFTMGFQFGFLARLVWWDYSWDIMEPVTYFVTYGTSIIMFCYFVMVKNEYNYDAARDRWNLRVFHKKSKRSGFDIEKYNSIAGKKKEVEENLRQLENVGALLAAKQKHV